MRALLWIVLVAACAAPGPKRPDESRRIPVNRSVPPELAGAGDRGDARRAEKPRREGEVEWR